MRVLQLRIGSWRNLRDVNLSVPEDSALVCLVGENGTGKSAILELLSAAAHEFGISQGVETNRGHPLSEPHDVTVVARVPVSTVPATMQRVAEVNGQWDGQMQLTSSAAGRQVVALGVGDPPLAQEIGAAAVQELRARNETQHLFLDADRAYPPTQFHPQQLTEIWNQDYTDPGFTKQWSYRPTRTLYEEWTKYLVSTEERTGARLISDTRRARAEERPDPVFVDPFTQYRELLQRVLPHLQFMGVQSTGAQRTVLFNSVGLDLTFSQLSGGEREIAFLVGQVDRFRLQRGLMLVDEPELHLNPDLLRTWLAFLRDTVQDGQVWFATHSLEAVEVAGPQATFVFERADDSRLVFNPRLLAGRPVLSALSAAIGSPAFSLSKRRFIFIEGDRQTRERERFYSVCGMPDQNRFLEGGGCDEVVRRLKMVTELAAETDEQLRVGGVIDRDFRSDVEAATLEADGRVHVLGCHEIENVFLQPAALAKLLDRVGKDPGLAARVVQDAADRFAGLWIADRAASQYAPTLPKAAKSALSDKTWVVVSAAWPAIRLQSVNSVPVADQPSWGACLDDAYGALGAVRETADYWRRCLGKQTLTAVPGLVGLSSGQILEQAVARLWDDEVEPPEDVKSLRDYLAAL